MRQTLERIADPEGFIFDPSLVLYLPLHQLDGASFMSRDAYGYLTTVTGALWRPDGRIMDGDDLLEHAVVDWRIGDTQGAMEVWFKSTATGASQVLFASSDTATDLYRLYFFIHSSDKLRVYQNDNDTADYLEASTDVADGNWHHAVLNSSGSAYSIIVDGADEGALTVQTGSNTGDWFGDTSRRDNITVGALHRSVTTNYFTGTIGEVRVYSQPLSLAAAQHNYLATKWRYQ